MGVMRAFFIFTLLFNLAYGSDSENSGVEGEKGTTQAESCETNLTEQECEAYATANSFRSYYTRSSSRYPTGCSQYGSSTIYYDSNNVDNAEEFSTPICKTLITGSPSAAPTILVAVEGEKGTTQAESCETNLSQQECEAYATANSLSYGVVPFWEKPRGCYEAEWHEGYEGVYWHHDEGPSQHDNAHPSCRPICKTLITGTNVVARGLGQTVIIIIIVATVVFIFCVALIFYCFCANCCCKQSNKSNEVGKTEL